MGYVSFEHGKEQFFRKRDKSRKGSIDKGIKKIVDIINRNQDYYTTSSCSGRTMLIMVPKKGRKWDSKWLFASHGRITFDELMKSLKKIPELTKEPVWLKKEGLIMHVCCRTVEAASLLCDAAIKSGFRRSGILTAKRKIVVEINDTERIELPVAMNRKVLIDDLYLRIIVAEANSKQERTRKKIEKFIGLLT